MGSYKKKDLEEVRDILVGRHQEQDQEKTWDMKEQFDRYLARKLEENDMVSYWIINDIYSYYLAALKDTESKTV